MYIRVYAPDGEPFDVTRERADKLILNYGWTQTQPKPVKKKRATTETDVESASEKYAEE